jgi:hypothetical protein
VRFVHSHSALTFAHVSLRATAKQSPLVTGIASCTVLDGQSRGKTRNDIIITTLPCTPYPILQLRSPFMPQAVEGLRDDVSADRAAHTRRVSPKRNEGNNPLLPPPFRRTEMGEGHDFTVGTNCDFHNFSTFSSPIRVCRMGEGWEGVALPLKLFLGCQANMEYIDPIRSACVS